MSKPTPYCAHLSSTLLPCLADPIVELWEDEGKGAFLRSHACAEHAERVARRTTKNLRPYPMGVLAPWALAVSVAYPENPVTWEWDRAGEQWLVATVATRWVASVKADGSGGLVDREPRPIAVSHSSEMLGALGVHPEKVEPPSLIDMKTIDSGREAFEERAFYLRTLNGDNPKRDVYFARDNSVREYKDPVVAAMWWAWRESRIVAAMPALPEPEPEPFETNKWQEWANEGHRRFRRIVIGGKTVKDNFPGAWGSAGTENALAAISAPPPDLTTDRDRAMDRARMPVCTQAPCNAVPTTRVWTPSMVNLQEPDKTLDGLDFCFEHGRDYIRRLPEDSGWEAWSNQMFGPNPRRRKP